jgi:hypothetical protein
MSGRAAKGVVNTTMVRVWIDHEGEKAAMYSNAVPEWVIDIVAVASAICTGVAIFFMLPGF